MSSDVLAPPGPEVNEGSLSAQDDRELQRRLRRGSLGRRVWAALWPKLLAVGIAVAIWQGVYLSGWREDYLLPSPSTVFGNLWNMASGNDPQASSQWLLWREIAITMQRGLTGFGISLVVGTLLGIAVAQWKVLRAGVGSMITGLQTMPSIAWFPLAILFFGLTETAILFVVILGAAPSVAAGVITGIDEVPPPLLRAGKMIGANGLNRYRHIVLPAAMPAYLAGLKQGWAFSWRSLMAAELIATSPDLGEGLGQYLHNAMSLSDISMVFAGILLIFVVGVGIELLVFRPLENSVLRARGLTQGRS
jgi:NitT/TauT family transport system permease protein